jgi:hypothetical protein
MFMTMVPHSIVAYVWNFSLNENNLIRFDGSALQQLSLCWTCFAVVALFAAGIPDYLLFQTVGNFEGMVCNTGMSLWYRPKMSVWTNACCAMWHEIIFQNRGWAQRNFTDFKAYRHLICWCAANYSVVKLPDIR